MFDDVFSGLDGGTEEYVFQNVFGPSGILRRNGTLVILATHSSKLDMQWRTAR